jgi:predicted ABC-type ATPase
MPNTEYKLSAETHEKIFQQLLSEMLAESDARKCPGIVVLGGQPGSGKSHLMRIAREKFFDNRPVTTINGDDYRAAHPKAREIYEQYDKTYVEITDFDVRKWTSMLLEAAVERKRDIVFETTMRYKEPLMSTIRRLKEKGYKIGIYVMAVNERISRIGSVQRYENQKAKGGIARWTPLDVHDEAYRKMPETVSAIENESPIDSLKIYNRAGELLYFNEREDGIFIRPVSNMNAKSAVIKERDRRLTLREQRFLRQAIKDIQKQMSDRGAAQDFNEIYSSLI